MAHKLMNTGPHPERLTAGAETVTRADASTGVVDQGVTLRLEQSSTSALTAAGQSTQSDAKQWHRQRDAMGL